MHPDDPDNPQNWPLARKLQASLCAFVFGFVVAFGLTIYAAFLPQLQKAFKTDMKTSIVGFSLYLFGIAFSPIHTPHFSERFGRRPVYFVSIAIFSLFLLGGAVSRTWTSLTVTRFFAGLTGGPCLVLIEGTFADVWSADATVTYYIFLTLSSFFGAASGPLVGGFISTTSWGWRGGIWVSFFVALGSLLLGIGMPETYPREILRARAKRQGKDLRLAPAQSGVTLAEMATHTFINPIKMLVSEPIVILLTLYVTFIFAVIFQFFILIPVVLSTTYAFTPSQVGLAFISAILGSILAAISAVLLDLPSASTRPTMHAAKPLQLEYRFRSALLGSILIPASLFWVAFTADPKIHFLAPITGTAVFIWGSALVLTSCISYIFDAYPPAGTLSALTAAAVLRLVGAGVLPLVIVQFVMAATGKWAVATFGFIGLGLAVITWAMHFGAGTKLRMGSRYNKHDMMMMVGMKGEETV